MKNANSFFFRTHVYLTIPLMGIHWNV